MNAIRTQFEAWAAENGYPTDYTPDAECGVEGGPVYADSRTHAAWWAYRAGLGTPEVVALVQQVRELCAATLRAGPGVAVEIPAELAEEGRKFMNGEPNLIVLMPFADVSSLGTLLADNPQHHVPPFA